MVRVGRVWAKSRPPGRRIRFASISVRWSSSGLRCSTMSSITTKSAMASGSGRRRVSAATAAARPDMEWAARVRWASVRASSEYSTPTACAAPISTATASSSPRPVPRSTTTSPGRRPARRSDHSIEGGGPGALGAGPLVEARTPVLVVVGVVDRGGHRGGRHRRWGDGRRSGFTRHCVAHAVIPSCESPRAITGGRAPGGRALRTPPHTGPTSSAHGRRWRPGR